LSHYFGKESDREIGFSQLNIFSQYTRNTEIVCMKEEAYFLNAPRQRLAI